MKTCEASFLQLQEHFKATKSVEKYFKKEFHGNDSYVIPAHRESEELLCMHACWTALKPYQVPHIHV